MKKRFAGAVACAALFLLTGCSDPTPSTTTQPTPQQEGSKPTATVTEAPVETPPRIQTVRLQAIGDILIHSSLYKDAKTPTGYDFRYMFEHVKPYLTAADLAIANQETMIGGAELGLSDYPLFNSPYEVGDALHDAGIDVVSIANNHSLDAGEQGILNATKHWDKLGIPYVGAYRSPEDAAELRVLAKNGISFAFLAYTYGTNGIPLPADKPYLVNLIDLENMQRDIRKAREQADVVVMSLHMGGEYQRLPNAEQQQLVATLAQAGVDIVLGHHPHVLQPPAWVDNGRGGRTYVIYSLGNFLSGQDEIYREIGGIAQLEVVKRTDGAQETITLQNPAFLPVWTHKKNWRQYKLYPLQNVTEQQLPRAQALYQEINAHMKKWMPELRPTLD